MIPLLQVAYECPKCLAYGTDIRISERGRDQFIQCKICRSSCRLDVEPYKEAIFVIYQMGAPVPGDAVTI